MIKIYYLEDNNGVFYIGKTKNTLPYRLSAHKFQFKNKGISNIKIYLLEEVKINEWKQWECYWIEQFKQWGFNLINKNNGGGGPLTHSSETIKKITSKIDYTLNGVKISNSKKGSKYNITIKGNKHALFNTTQSKETIDKKIKSLTGQTKSPYKIRKDKGKSRPHTSKENHYLFGKNISQTHSLNKSQSALGNKNRSKPIKQLDLNSNLIHIFESAAEAERQLNIKGIRNVCCGIAKTAGGFKWEYE
jgi:predicted GIY-YIG superfamily endonuclease